MSSYVSWLSDLCYRLLPDCFNAQFQISRYVNVMGVIQLLEAVTYAPLLGFMADWLESLYVRHQRDLHQRVAALRANATCLAICAVFGCMSSVVPCIGEQHLPFNMDIT